MDTTLMILAVLLAPLIAVQVQKRLEVLRENRNRKLNIFYTLMATRASRVSAQHVQALNMIDIEFYGRRIFGRDLPTTHEKAVRRAWKEYLDHLNSRDVDSNTWAKTSDDLFTKLLEEMARALGYDFDKVLLKKGIYSPKAHGDLEEDQRAIRENLAQILSGKLAIPVTIKSYQPLDEALGRAKQQATHIAVPTGSDIPNPFAERVNPSSATPSARADDPTQT